MFFNQLLGSGRLSTLPWERTTPIVPVLAVQATNRHDRGGALRGRVKMRFSRGAIEMPVNKGQN